MPPLSSLGRFMYFLLFINDGKFCFGFVKKNPAICSQGRNEFEVYKNLKKYEKTYNKRK
jgi:hypothetical protein